MYIDGKIPFKEANTLEFEFKSNWKVDVVGEKEPYLFYLEKGKRIITLEVTLGDLTDSLMRASESLKQLNQVNWDLLTVLGVNPDLERDYNIGKYMPGVVATFKEQAEIIKSVAADWVKMTGKQDANVSLMNQLVFQL